ETAYDKYVASLSEGEYPVPCECFEQAQEEGELNIYDWAEWWPEELYTNFEKEFGIKIVRDNFASEPEVVAKFKLNPEMSYDMINGIGLRTTFQMIEIDALQELNHDWLPNAFNYIGPEFTETEQDPGCKYSIIDSCSFDAYYYNEKYVDDARLPSWGVLFEPEEKYRGRITVVDDMYKVLADALAYLGYPIDSDDEGELMEVRDLMMKFKPFILTFDSWPKRLMLEEEAWICGGSYAEGLMLHKENEGITSQAPLEPSRLTTEVMQIPIGAPHPAAAHLWMNYIFRPQVSAFMCEVIGMQPANPAAWQYLDEDMQEWLAGIPEGYVAGCREIGEKGLTGQGKELRTAIWEELKS
ncbi:MAG: spermidine/putrescine ABC transporter substrate-binding protein, partial [Dehalococcoidia bacterium]|nr:spermidine/putrescine ABC transporter substrate-binding protein [Dehalococcoidia bacterium]